MPSQQAHPKRVRRSAWAARRTAFSALVVVSTLWLGSAIWEAWGEGVLASDSLSLPGESRSVAQAESDALLENVAQPTSETPQPARWLPSNVEGWVAQGPQEVPGSAGTVFELVLTPQGLDEERSLVTPLAVYVQVAVSGSPEANIERALSSTYDIRRGSGVIGERAVFLAERADGRSYFVGWVQDGVAIGVDASFTQVVPARASDRLEVSAKEIALVVMDTIERGSR